ncbi:MULTISPECIES: hypothetical protein [unclassified Microbacterium]|uniref:hypothetical protein n=1 Tax=unclassified Microbacterium TaxID=2609290 RepID=UPI0030197FFA
MAAVERTRAPMWLHLVTALVLGSATVAVLLLPGVAKGLAVLAMAIAMAVLEGVRRRLLGARVTELHRGRSSTIIVSIFAIATVAALVAGWVLADLLDSVWTSWLTGGVVALLVASGGVMFDRARRRAATRD